MCCIFFRHRTKDNKPEQEQPSAPLRINCSQATQTERRGPALRRTANAGAYIGSRHYNATTLTAVGTTALKARRHQEQQQQHQQQQQQQRQRQQQQPRQRYVPYRPSSSHSTTAKMTTQQQSQQQQQQQKQQYVAYRPCCEDGNSHSGSSHNQATTSYVPYRAAYGSFHGDGHRRNSGCFSVTPEEQAEWKEFIDQLPGHETDVDAWKRRWANA